jgi:hypothetical protein
VFVFVSPFRGPCFYARTELGSKADRQVHEGGLRDYAGILPRKQERGKNPN